MKNRSASKHPNVTRILIAGLAVCLPAAGQQRPEPVKSRKGEEGLIEPRIPRPKTRKKSTQRQRPNTRPQDGPSIEFPSEVRGIDGRDNNLNHSEWGAAATPFLRLYPNDYDDGVSSPAVGDRPSARVVSNEVMAQADDLTNGQNATDYLWQWGQFLDHDITETPVIDPQEPFNIAVPPGDALFDPFNTGTVEIPLNRSFYEEIDGVRQQVNEITSYIDASNVYGSSEERAFALRSLDGSGRLKTTSSDHGDLLPYNFTGLDNAGGTSPIMFLAGDVRANEQTGLLAMHTLFVREHNHWADRYRELNPEATGEETYQFARMIVGAEMQVITYHEFLPLILGRPLPKYRGYRPDVNAGISNTFATGAYRFGHSLLSPTLMRVDAEGNEVAAGHLSLAEAFFRPSHIEDEGIESVLRGLAAQKCQELDAKVIDEVRNFLFGPPGSGGLDLAALNIQRGRDHGIPSYNDMCRAIGQPPARRWRDVNPDREIASRLAAAYDDVEDLDCWAGMLCEPHKPGAMIGPMLEDILVDQFTRLRDGDRFWYQNHLPRNLIALVEQQTLARIIRRNTEIGAEIPDNVFVLEKRGRRPNSRPQRSNQTERQRRDR